MGLLSLATGGMSTVYKYVAIAGLALGLAVGGFFYGHHVAATAYELKAAQVQAKYEKEESDLLGLQNITNTRIVTQVVTKTVTIHDNTNQLQQQIPNLTDTGFLTDGWLRIHDAAALGLSSTPSPTDNTASAITADSALKTITGNYDTCNAERTQLQGLIDWEAQTHKNIATADGQKK